MAKVKQVKSARASTKRRVCRQCQHEVQVGEAYKYIDKKTGPRSGIRLIFCHRHHPRGSDLLSGRAADLARITEDYDDQVNSIEATPGSLPQIAEALESAAEEVRRLAGEIRESAEAIQDGFGHSTAQSEAMTNTADELDEWADRMDQHKDDVAGWSVDEDSTEEQNLEKVQELFGDADSLMSEEPELQLTG